MRLKLYRGIAVRQQEAEGVKKDILSKGFNNEKNRSWNFDCVDLRDRLKILIEKKDLTTEDTRPSRKVSTRNGWQRELIGGFPATCACGDILGASYYALKHNQRKETEFTHGLVITFHADIVDVQVDGRDFLYNSVFGRARTKGQRKMACQLFGDGVAKYLDLAIERAESSYKFAICDLAVQDSDVIKGHSKNNLVIGGRYGTVFKSAFFVRVPIQVTDIIAVEEAKQHSFVPDITMEYYASL